jgi:hypothetical protein
VFADLHASAQKAGGVTQAMVAALKPPVVKQLRAAGLGVPPSVREPVEGVAAAAAATAVPLENRIWFGVLRTYTGVPANFSVVFAKGRGTLKLERGAKGVAASMELRKIDVSGTEIRFPAALEGGMRYFVGSWNGQKIEGKLYADPQATKEVGAFDLTPR